ncbi:MAG: hypothetical protein V5A38_01625 [Halolamina sp.]|uniref:hypothetical protein n=1 Tax=Halolamina sp. TaxID=1940283 RepID=UPI002FC30BE4
MTDGAGSADATSGATESAVSEPIALPPSLLARFERFTSYNSPYPAHDRGCAIDLYPESNAGISPVPGAVLDTRTVRCPDRTYAVGEDHLILIDVADDWADGRGAELTARVLHVDPAVEAGDRVEPGDPLGEMVRSGFFGQWVDNHVHLGFRPAGANPYRASGSLPLAPDVPVSGATWDGTGTVVETGETYARLDAPAHPEPGHWATVASDEGTPLDGGLAHYSGGGVYGVDDPAAGRDLSLLGTPVGSVAPRAEGGVTASATADVTWNGVEIRANDERATGLSLFASTGPFGAKLVFHEGHAFSVGDELSVEISPGESVRLG